MYLFIIMGFFTKKKLKKSSNSTLVELVTTTTTTTDSDDEAGADLFDSYIFHGNKWLNCIDANTDSESSYADLDFGPHIHESGYYGWYNGEPENTKLFNTSEVISVISDNSCSLLKLEDIDFNRVKFGEYSSNQSEPKENLGSVVGFINLYNQTVLLNGDSRSLEVISIESLEVILVESDEFVFGPLCYDNSNYQPNSITSTKKPSILSKIHSKLKISKNSPKYHNPKFPENRFRTPAVDGLLIMVYWLRELATQIGAENVPDAFKLANKRYEYRHSKRRFLEKIHIMKYRRRSIV